jgi:hypothetical protein
LGIVWRIEIKSRIKSRKRIKSQRKRRIRTIRPRGAFWS